MTELQNVRFEPAGLQATQPQKYRGFNRDRFETVVVCRFATMRSSRNRLGVLVARAPPASGKSYHGTGYGLFNRSPTDFLVNGQWAGWCRP
eukprot:5404386-Prymnesium_polylepis.1